MDALFMNEVLSVRLFTRSMRIVNHRERLKDGNDLWDRDISTPRANVIYGGRISFYGEYSVRNLVIRYVACAERDRWLYARALRKRRLEELVCKYILRLYSSSKYGTSAGAFAHLSPSVVPNRYWSYHKDLLKSLPLTKSVKNTTHTHKKKGFVLLGTLFRCFERHELHRDCPIAGRSNKARKLVWTVLVFPHIEPRFQGKEKQTRLQTHSRVHRPTKVRSAFPSIWFCVRTLPILPGSICWSD